jgi:hypothetical protein
MHRLSGDTPDISVLLRFHFWQKVYNKQVHATLPSDSVAQVVHIVGISEHCGNDLTCHVQNPYTLKIIHCSSILPATAVYPNLCAESIGGEIDDDIAPVLKYRHDFNDEYTKLHSTNNNTPPPSFIDM